MSWKKDFEKFNREFRPRPLWFWNGELVEGEIRNQVRAISAEGNSGFGIVPAYGMSAPGAASSSAARVEGRELYMTPAFLDAYETAVDEAAKLGLKVCVYDEFWFPSGWAGGQLAQRYPESLSKRLDLHATELAGPTRYQKLVPPEKLMAAVAMNVASFERIDLTASIRDNWLTWDVPAGQWRIMFFLCVTDGAKGLIDYLDPEAVDNYLGLSYDKFFERLGSHFGSTIDSAFYDEPTFHWVEGGRAWTGDFNEKFQTQFHHSPDLLYPAMWYDIGPQTASARHALFGLRSELFATSYVKRMNDWCRARGIVLTGHVDQEEVANPVGICGDLMKVFEYQDIPAFDQVFEYGRSHRIAKVVSSAAINYNRQLTLCECYGVTAGLADDDAHLLFAEAIDLFSRGMNVLVPHAIWFDPDGMEFPPNMSSTDPEVGPFVAEFNEWVGRVQSVLQFGTTVADIAIVYPIESMMASYRFGAGGNPYLGGLSAPEMELDEDYLIVGDVLTSQLQRDFVYLHPDILDSKCVIGEDKFGTPVLELRHGGDEAGQQFRAIILPSSTAISVATLTRLKQFHDAGGILISTGRQPQRAVGALASESAAIEANDDVIRTIRELFGPNGHGSSILTTDAGSLRAVLDDRLEFGDVRIDLPNQDVSKSAGGHVSCLHKKRGNTDVYFIGNTTRSKQSLSIEVRARHRFEQWNPKSGAKHPVESHEINVDSFGRTRFELRIGPAECALLVTVPD